MNLNHMLNMMLSCVAAAILLAGNPSQATIISAAAEGSLGMAVYCEAGGGNDVLSGTGVMAWPGLNSSAMTQFELGADANAAAVVSGNVADCGAPIAPFTAIPDFTSPTMRTSGQVDYVAGANNDVVGALLDRYSSMPTGAGGSAVNAVASSGASHSGSGANTLTPASHPGPIPEPISVVIVACGLLGVSLGISRYFA